MTCFLVVADADDCVTLASVEPRRSVASLVHRPGTRHPLDRGAPGLALLSTTAETGRERAELTAARRLGYAASHDEVIPGLSSLAAPIPSAHGGASAAVAVVYVGADVDVARVGRRLQAAAAQIAAAIG
jgi:DNA-binding IclR family transcriptional regulator